MSNLMDIFKGKVSEQTFNINKHGVKTQGKLYTYSDIFLDMSYTNATEDEQMSFMMILTDLSNKHFAPLYCAIVDAEKYNQNPDLAMSDMYGEEGVDFRLKVVVS